MQNRDVGDKGLRGVNGAEEMGRQGDKGKCGRCGRCGKCGSKLYAANLQYAQTPLSPLSTPSPHTSLIMPHAQSKI